MDTRDGEDLRQTGRGRMNAEINLPAVRPTRPATPPARVKLQRVNCNYFKPYPPDGQEKLWWERLKKALGTASSDFVNATLLQIQNASRLPGAGISETGINAILALIKAAEPKNEIEAALAIQMACSHSVTMVLLERLGGGFRNDQSMARLAGAASRLMRASAMHVETLRRLRSGGSQHVRVEHVHVNDGGQAVIGNIKSGR